MTHPYRKKKRRQALLLPRSPALSGESRVRARTEPLRTRAGSSVFLQAQRLAWETGGIFVQPEHRARVKSCPLPGQSPRQEQAAWASARAVVSPEHDQHGMPQSLPFTCPWHWWLLERQCQRCGRRELCCFLGFVFFWGVFFNHYFIKGEGTMPSDNFLQMLCQSCAALLFLISQGCRFVLPGTFTYWFADSFVACIRKKVPFPSLPCAERNKE